jgi:putative tryptophan/tyrosine transport system substrate-binding protein
MDRRAFLGTFAGGLLAVPLATEAQPVGKVYHVGYLAYGPPDVVQANLVMFREALLQRGYVEGRNLAFEVRTSPGRLDILPELATELARLHVDVILAVAPLAIRAARQATSTIPIVMALGDPATFENLARPGGNVTGVTALAAELAGKQVELLKEAVPRVSRVGVLRNPDQPVHVTKLKQAEITARALAMRLIVADARGADDLETAFATIAHERAEGLIVFADGVFQGQRRRVVEHAARLRLPAVYALDGFVQAGGLIAYVPDIRETFRRAASFADRIFKGANPATLPVEQPTRFELSVNLATARTLGLALPQSLLVRADQLIE